MTDVTIPTGLWNDGDEAAISAWLYSDGDIVAQGAIVAEIMVEKSSFELVAPAAGSLTILVPAEEAVRPGQVAARIG
ncbi:lipoyl domain-containing protein [Sphingopyxis sp. XHP0097]|uniref:Lipoyl domain-containing protein n=1 Tax=Sphingopyxis jiangsuensis TaxID=2871171 RepID=A0ABS7MGD9_9SPHN|nr:MULTISPECIES: lipoyl domain-containing protein [Sphingopyxis]MBL0768802.1 lipoyl domain-containing protein [Sphingopyxis lutea]MBY4638090.1 lipoyl domain-containing protein [Sphingopyxis jiangsuensis]